MDKYKVPPKIEKHLKGNILHQATEDLGMGISLRVDTVIKMAIKDKPKFVPNAIWRRIIKALLNVEVVNKFQ